MFSGEKVMPLPPLVTVVKSSSSSPSAFLTFVTRAGVGTISGATAAVYSFSNASGS